MATRLYVGNLSYNTTEEEIKELFEGIGPVASASLVIDRESGRSKGFAFVEFTTDEDAQKAITELNDKDLGGRKLVVNEARPKSDAPRTGGNGGGGYRGGNGGGQGGNGGGSRWY